MSVLFTAQPPVSRTGTNTADTWWVLNKCELTASQPVDYKILRVSCSNLSLKTRRDPSALSDRSSGTHSLT